MTVNRLLVSRFLLLMVALLIGLSACIAGGYIEPTPGVTAFVGARLIDGTETEPIESGTIVVRDGRLEAVGPSSEVDIPEDATQLNLVGRTIIPGLINAHGHVGETRGLESGQYSADNISRQLGLYARYGVTTVLSLGGDGVEARAVRKAEERPGLHHARLRFAGIVVSGATVDEVRAVIDANVELGADFIKIRVDDNLGTSTKMSRHIYEAVIERAHEHGLPVAAHIFYLEDAVGLLRAGVDFIAHSVRDVDVDQELIDLLTQQQACYCPTLTREVSTFIYESEPNFFTDPFFLRDADPDVPERQQYYLESHGAQAYKVALQIAQGNLRRLAGAGVTIAFGTDSGPPARFQGYFEHMEIEMMAASGLSPIQILRAATGDAAACLGLKNIGTLEAGKRADLVVLSANPLQDVRNMRTIESVWVAGNLVPRADG